MAEPTLETMLDKRFADIQKRREDLLARRAEIEKQLHAVDEEYQRVKTAQDALAGKFKGASTPEKKPRVTSGRRGSRDQLRERILDLLKQHPEGLVANQITAAIPDKAVPNLLSLMKKDEWITQDAKRGPYKLGASYAHPQPGV